MKRAWQEALFRLWPVRFLLALLFVARGACYRLLGKPYRALNDFCWVARVSRSGWPEALARRAIFRIVRIAQSSPHNPVVAAFRADPASDAVAGLYAQSGRGPRDLFRDVIVLKAATDDEKGVILLKYARTFSALAALYDLERLMRRYVFVLEPCWAGYCDPSTLMYLAPAQPVLIMCFTAEDLAFIESIGAPFVPLAMGPADWVNADVFKPPATIEKRYDLVMVANWARHKRHAQLFAALANVRERDVRVLLIGFPWGARTADDIRAEAAAMRNPRVELTIFESLPHTRVAELVAASKVFVFLSRKEGDNKALVEAMFADVPAIVFAESIGGARSRINPATGMLAQDSELADADPPHARSHRGIRAARLGAGTHRQRHRDTSCQCGAAHDPREKRCSLHPRHRRKDQRAQSCLPAPGGPGAVRRGLRVRALLRVAARRYRAPGPNYPRRRSQLAVGRQAKWSMGNTLRAAFDIKYARLLVMASRGARNRVLRGASCV